MPRYDGTGPFGDGRFGRGLGPCGRGEGRGFGARGGLRRRFFGYDRPGIMYPYSQESLQAQKQELEEQLKWIDEELKKGK